MVKRLIAGRMNDPVRRRDFLKGAAALGAASACPAIITRRGYAADTPTVVNSIRSLSNPYHATWNKGGAAFAKSVGAEYVTLVTEGNSEKGIADIKAILAKTGGNCVINVDPNDSPDARPIVEAVKAAGAYVVTQWNKPNDLHPWDFDPNYVAHISFSGVPYGKAMAETLIKAMGGKGGIVALGGIESNVPAIERKAGLQQALKENPGVELLDMQVANWQATEALEKTNAWLTQFGDKIGGIWAANDDMGLAAVEALRADGRAGKVPVTGIDGIQLAVEAILKGEMAGTVAWDPYWQGGMGLSIGYHAKTGKFDPSKEPKEHREFYGKGVIITAENAQSFYNTNIKSEPTLDWNDIWGRVSGHIQYQ
jgi:ribose transport system substrate-binding protein